ncbi:transglutaminase domain-containing protein [Lihuaxuella thermophila]|uniref:Transglutaminase-like enzyme, putative cysteine protease n=1 Tax=Lihuaxuella thermophila TaxID=1173111 RepID=A0A1H8C7L5_9BACL|nr:transglutaminase domain-containing protein [Lihuaxuella thermophila]SEM91036.1 Transglutaminase-like enzyme, putative cysteine protease [Lihuaxuella thermophila]
MLSFVLYSCDEALKPGTVAVQSPEGTSWGQKLNGNVGRFFSEQIQLEPYAQKVGGSLTTPRFTELAVKGTVQVSGTVREYRQLSSPFVWIQVDFLGKGEPALPASFHYYVPLRQGRFSEQIRLFSGQGAYKVMIRLPGKSKDKYYYPFAAFKVFNQSGSVVRDIAYSVAAMRAGLSVSSPLTGYTVNRESIRLAGRWNQKSGPQKLLIQERKGEKVWKRVIPVKNLRFEESLPLLFGKGIHEFQVMVPDEQREGYYIDGATFYVNNTSEQERMPVQYTDLYQKRGIRLTSPLAGGHEVGTSIRVSGRIDPDGEYARQTDHLIVQTTKGKVKATYFIPVKGYRFDSRIWMRFGPGKYWVTVYVPEVTKEKRDFFRFYTVANLQVESRSRADLRDLLPSRGVESNHPAIRELARKITAGKTTDKEKAKAVYRYVAQNMEYDMEKFRRNTFAWDDSALKAMRTKKGVCQDFAFLSIALLRSMEIPARFVEGEAGGQRHAWVEARIGGDWLIMDPTWGSGYITTEGRFVKKYDPSYFNPSPQTFARTHKRNGVLY